MGKSMEKEATMLAGYEAFPTSLTWLTIEGCFAVIGVISICKPML
jgi:hypothetical protein